MRPSSQHRNSDSKGQCQQAEYIDASVYEINTKPMLEKGARIKVKRNLEIVRLMDKHENRRRGEVDVRLAELVEH